MSTTLKRTMIIMVGVLLAALMVVLGLWQMRTARLHGREATEQRAAQPPVALATEVPSGTNVDPLYGRQVTVTGSYLPEQQVYVGTKYPLRVVTAFRTSDGRVLAVVRGSVASPSVKASAPPSGTVTQTGLVLPSEEASRAGLPLQDAGHSPIVGSLRIPQLVQSWPTPMINGFVSLGSSDARAQGLDVAPVTLPDGQESTRNAGYALQWWVFAGVAVVGSVVISRSVRPSRLNGVSDPVIDQPQSPADLDDDLDAIHPDDVATIRKSLLFYRVMAYVVGVLLVVLVCVGLPLKYIWNDDRVVVWTGVPHGWLYMILIISAFNVGRRVNWSWLRLILIALAGTVPFLSFVAEHYATKDVRAKLAAVPEASTTE